MAGISALPTGVGIAILGAVSPVPGGAIGELVKGSDKGLRTLHNVHGLGTSLWQPGCIRAQAFLQQTAPYPLAHQYNPEPSLSTLDTSASRVYDGLGSTQRKRSRGGASTMSLAAMVLADRIEPFMRYYDWWMHLITLGRDRRVRTAVLQYVQPGESLLDVGCGTGTLAIGAARQGAKVTGVDRSRRMLDLAREKARREGLEVGFREGDVAILPLRGEVFDVATATFVLGELSLDEATLSVRSMAEAVRPGGRVIIVDETAPHNPFLRLISALQRLPFALVAFLVLQKLAPTHRHPWRLVLAEAGLIVREESRYLAGTLTVLVAERPTTLPPLRREATPLVASLPRGIAGALLRVAAWWAFPIPIPPGVYYLGSPDAHAPVFLTGNFLASVEAVCRALAQFNCYVIVQDTSGWNIWCASDAGLFTAERAAAQMQLYGIEQLVAHRRVVIPGLGGRIRARLAELTRWEVITGPLAARDLPEFLEKLELTQAMQSLDRMYPLRERLRVSALTAVQLPVWLLPLRLLPSSLRRPVWRFALAASWSLPLLHYLLPGRTGVVKGQILGLGVGAAMLVANPARWAAAAAIAASAPFIGWIYQSTSPVVYWKRIWK